MPNLEPFATVQELRDHLQDQALDTASAELALDNASGAVRDWTRQIISLVEGDAEAHDGAGHAVLLLRELPIVEVAQVTVGGETVTDWYATENGVLRRTGGGVWPENEKVEVTYSHGFAEIPQGVVRATVELAGLAMENPTRAQSERVGQASMTHMLAGGGSAEKEIRDRLGRYRVAV